MQVLETNTLFANKYLLIKQLGLGGFAVVWEAEDQTAKLNVALKIYLRLDNEGIDIFRDEYRMLFNLNHSNLLKATYFDIFEGQPFLVMPFCSNGTALKSAGKIQENELAKLIYDVSSGLEYLHALDPPIIHQDIKPDNFLIDDNGNYLLSDFGISQRMRRTLTKSVAINKNTVDMNQAAHSGTAPAAYRAPELFSKNFEARKPVKANDIFSFGVSVYEMTSAEMPFGDLGGLLLLQDAEIPDIPETFSKGLNSLVERCLAKEPWDRPTASQIKDEAHFYLQNGFWRTEKSTPTKPVVAETIKQKAETLFGKTRQGQVPSTRQQVEQTLKDESHSLEQTGLGNGMVVGKNSRMARFLSNKYVNAAYMVLVVALIGGWIYFKFFTFKAEYVKFDLVSASTKNLKLIGISLGKNETVATLEYTCHDSIGNFTIYLDDPMKKYAVVDVETGTQYLVTNFQGLLMQDKKPRVFHKGQSALFYLYFPGLPRDVKKINLIEGSIDLITGGHFFDLNLRKNELPDQFNKKLSGWMNFCLKDYQTALSELSSWIDQNPGDADAYFRRGQVYFRYNNMMAAVDDFRNAILISEKGEDNAGKQVTKARYYFFRGMAYSYLKQYVNAVADLGIIIDSYRNRLCPLSLKEEYRSAYYYRGLANHYNNNYSPAIDDYTKYLEYYPNSSWVYYCRAYSKYYSGDKAGALEDCRKVRETGDTVSVKPNDLKAAEITFQMGE